MNSPSKLFQPIDVGDLPLKHRVVLAPLTRFRAHKDHVLNSHALTYYAQRASTPGTLLITEATFISQKAGGFDHVPGIYTEEQIEAWKSIVSAVHAKGSFIFMQLWALGRAADVSVLKRENNSPHVSSSSIPLTGHTNTPRSLTIPEIEEYVQDYVLAAKNAVNLAGFDGVEIHGANGYLIDQFLQNVSNNRTDGYGGSVQDRAKFALEVVRAVSNAVGASRTAIRLSPWSPFQDMGMSDPVPTYSYLVRELCMYDLAYLHVIEPRVGGAWDCDGAPSQSNQFIRDIWGRRTYISAGGYTRQTALNAAEKGGLIAFGRLFISNPDLPLRLLKDISLTPADIPKHYQPGNLTPSGYTDWPFTEGGGVEHQRLPPSSTGI
ncbi:hypothetical protein BJ138DRAFT_1130863 [Hygrophoropsis aurantiaca]|uniref:Uncharacterized protein n=1 Tax=Hygrophoropsis aurantiaca TaxID=72124 RepID=A0ACB7ZWE1_9AGAM|nr:hypothetical protein BJ138DRAFT_1130863 [Hygrophoropsis aurantiaca]